MTSKIKIDIAKIKEERKQYASKLDHYNKCKAKVKKASQVIRFDELKKFHALEQLTYEPSIPVEEYGDPVGICILEPEQYQSIWNATSAYKRAIQRRGQSNLKISNILKYSDYSKEEKQSIGLNLFYLMSNNPEYTSQCITILDQWIFEWQPSFLQICILLENLGCNVRKQLGADYHIPGNYQETVEQTKLEYVEINSKTPSKHLELNIECLRNVLTYLKSVIGCLTQEEVQSILVILSALALDTQCIQFKELFNELINKCFACLDLDTSKTDQLLKTLYLMHDNSMHQCYLVNKVLNPCSDQCKPFVIRLSYLFMCNLLFNNELVVTSTSFSTSINNNQVDENDSNSEVTKDDREHQRQLRSKRKLADSKEKLSDFLPSSKKLQLAKEIQQNEKLQVKKETLVSLEKENKKLNSKKSTKQTTRKGKGKPAALGNPKQVQKSILDYMKYREKSPDLSLSKSPVKQTTKVSSSNSPAKQATKLFPSNSPAKQATKLFFSPAKRTSPRKLALLSEATKAITDTTQNPLLGSSHTHPQTVETLSTLPSSNTIDLTCDSDDTIPPGNYSQKELIFLKYHSDIVSFSVLRQRIRHRLHDHLDNPIRIYRIVNLLNNIIQLLRIEEDSMPMCKLIMQELSHVQYKYYGLHDIHRHLVCVYLQQYTTMWGTHINRIQYRIDQRNQDFDSD